MSGFDLDKISLQRLVGVHPDLIRVVRDCAANWTATSLTFAVSEGLRSMAQQQENVRAGVSQTLKSRHLDGHAADLVALLPGNKISWAWPAYYTIAAAMREASIRTRIPIVWGGCWDTELEKITDDMHTASVEYIARARAKGDRGFVDGPHHQLPWDSYPSTAPPPT